MRINQEKLFKFRETPVPSTKLKVYIEYGYGTFLMFVKEHKIWKRVQLGGRISRV